jgi:hypothetical protein
MKLRRREVLVGLQWHFVKLCPLLVASEISRGLRAPRMTASVKKMTRVLQNTTSQRRLTFYYFR